MKILYSILIGLGIGGLASVVIAVYSWVFFNSIIMTPEKGLALSILSIILGGIGMLIRELYNETH